MGQQGFRTLNSNPYVYQEIDSGVSIAYGVDTSVNLIKIKAQTTAGATPTGTPQIEIDPAVNGDITLTPNGIGVVDIAKNLTVSSGTITFTPLVAARPSTVKSTAAGVLTTLIDSNVDGQIQISSNAGAPIWASLTAGANIIITPGHNSITIDSTGGMIWTPVAGVAVNLAADYGYLLENAALTTATLPVTCAQGDTISIYGSGTGLFTIAQNAGQSIHLGNAVSTVGVLGSVSSTAQFDCINLVCLVADTVFGVISSVGNFTLL